MNSAAATLVRLRAERWAAPEPARLAMCMRLDAACIAVPAGDRLAYSPDEGQT